MSKIKDETAGWQEWRGYSSPAETTGWTVSPAVENPANPERTGESVPHPIEVRRALKAWAANKPPEVRNLAGTICQLMWMSERYPKSNAVRAVLAANLARLETATAE
jgi:hypothetical protein